MRFKFTDKQWNELEWVAEYNALHNPPPFADRWKGILERVKQRAPTIEDLIEIYNERPRMGIYTKPWMGKRGIFAKIRKYAMNEGYIFDITRFPWSNPFIKEQTER